MKLIECVDDILLGFLKKEVRHTSNDKTIPYKILTIKSVNNRFINKKELDEFESLVPIDNKYLTKENDVVVCTRPPYNVVLIDKDTENILVSSNFIILRNSKINENYLYNYLNLIGISMKLDKDDDNVNIKKTDIEQVEVISDEDVIKKISNITAHINRRQNAYEKLIDNDQELIQMIFEKEGVFENE